MRPHPRGRSGAVRKPGAGLAVGINGLMFGAAAGRIQPLAEDGTDRMAREIERKFLVDTGAWIPSSQGRHLRQAYLSTVEQRTVRIRTCGAEAFLTVKGLTTGITRLEFEYAIPLADAQAMIAELCEKPILDKTRFRETVAGHTFEIDVFHADNEGLVVAELELSSADEMFERPAWLGVEVSGDPRYYNSNLARKPFRSWPTEGR